MTATRRPRTSSRPASRSRSRVQTPQWFVKRSFKGIHAALYQPPKVATWICRRPNYPQVDYGKRPLPTGVFFLWRGPSAAILVGLPLPIVGRIKHLLISEHEAFHSGDLSPVI